MKIGIYTILWFTDHEFEVHFYQNRGITLSFRWKLSVQNALHSSGGPGRFSRTEPIEQKTVLESGDTCINYHFLKTHANKKIFTDSGSKVEVLIVFFKDSMQTEFGFNFKNFFCCGTVKKKSD